MITHMEPKRSYTMSRRAESQEETRQRIVEAAMELHEELGPRNTTIKAIAERAGVQRLTVYRHFPSDADVFAACTSHWSTLNPPPDPRPWGVIVDPVMRAVVALSELYAYFSRTQGMWRVSYRDVSEVSALQAPMARFDTYLDVVAETLVAAFPEAERTLVAATVHHAATFQSWATLDAQGLTNPMKAATVAAWLRGLVAGGSVEMPIPPAAPGTETGIQTD
jgi:AcrR family transcriptional regulator